MSNKYREFIDRSARARIFKGGSYVLITAEPEDQDRDGIKIPYSEVKHDE